MSLLTANLEALGRIHPAVAGRLASLATGPDRGQWSVSRAGSPTVRRNGAALASAFDPVAEAVRAVPRWDDAVDFAVLPGLGAGYLAEAVAARYPDLPLVLAESDPSWFVEVLTHRDLSALWSPSVVPLLGPESSAVGEFLGALSCPRVEILRWRPLADQEAQWHRELERQVAGAQARSRVNVATYRRFARLWRRNLHKNEALAKNLRPLSALAGLWAGVPAVVAAAGPSLTDSIGWMKAFRSRFVLIAVDTAWPALARWGLEPDFLLVLDGQYWNARHVDRIPPEKTLVVTEWTGPPRAFRLAPGRTFVASSSVPFLRAREEGLWGSLGMLPSGGSVATAAWSLALHLGCVEVAFAGLDLGYPRGQTHAAGSQFEEAFHRTSFRLNPAETLGLGLRGLSGLEARPALDGGQVLSDPRMDLFRDWLSASVRARPQVRAFNLGTRGSLIPGLLSPPPGWGKDWPEAAERFPDSPPLVRLSSPGSRPPFPVLSRALEASDFSMAAEEAWSAARAFWGSDVWDAWAGRAWNTWKRFPSPRSRRAVVEVLELALTWEGFWDAE